MPFLFELRFHVVSRRRIGGLLNTREFSQCFVQDKIRRNNTSLARSYSQSTMAVHLFSSLALISALFIEIHADPTISTSTPTPCYGDVVTLVCHHPDVASNPGRYFSQPTAWEENGVGITPIPGTMFTGEIAKDRKSSTLNITITVDHFRNKPSNYSCLLVLAENGRPSGEVETSENVTVDPVEPLLPSMIVKTTCDNTSIAIAWTHTPMKCYMGRISYYVSWVNINNNTENGSDTTSVTEYNITGRIPDNTYTISVKTVLDGNVQSTAVSRNVTTDSPKPLHNITLTPCDTSINVSLEHDNCSCFEDQMHFVTWQEENAGNNSRIGNYTINGTIFNIENLKFNTSYLICASTVCPLDGRVHGGEICLNTTTLAEIRPSPLTECPPYLALIIVVVALVGVIIVVATGVCLWSKRRSRRIGCVKYEPLWLLQVTDTLNQNGVKIVSVQGNCVSAECDPCLCKREATTVDIYGTFNEMSFVMTFLKSGEDNMEEFIAELLRQKSILSADYCFALWAGGSVPRKVRSQFRKEPEWRKESCAVLPVQGFPWKVDSKHEKRFVQLFKSSTPPLNIEIEAMHQVSLGLSRQEGEITLTVEESEQVTVTIPHSDPPQVDVVKLVELLPISKPLTTKETDEDVKVPLESAYASVTSPLDKYESVGSHTSIALGGRRRSYTRSTFIDGVVSVLEILHVTILSVGSRCRRPECQDPNSCTHLNTFQPDVVGVFGDASFVIKCVLHRHDGDVIGEHVATLNNVRTGLGLPLGLLVYDHMEGDPQLLSQQVPNGCSLVRVGPLTWDCDWVKSTLVALCKAFKTPLALDTCPPVHQVQYAGVLVDKNRPVPNPPEEKVNYSEISAIGVKAAQHVEDKPPPVPPKKETNPMEEQFQTAIIEALTEIGMTFHLKELDFFTATYQSMEFLGVSRVESKEDVTPANVEKVVRAKTKMAASRAVLICNQDMIPSDRLIDLKEDSCYFIKAGGYGTEKWKNWLISNFKETVSDWMKEQNPGPHHSVEEGKLLNEDRGLFHPEEEEGVGHPKEESGLSQESTKRISPMTLVTRLESDDLSEEQSPSSNSEFI